MITINATGDTTIYTAGKYCEEDIFVKVPEGGGGTEDLEAVLAEQEALIAELQEILQGKASEDLEAVLAEQEALIAELQETLSSKASGEVVEPIIQPLTVTENGTYTAPSGVDGYSPVKVNVPIPDGYIKPSGTKNITENGEHDVTEYASVNVSVPTGGGGEINTGMCSVKITVPSTSNYYVCRESVGSDGTINYNIMRSYTSGTISTTARCDSVMYIQASTIKGAVVSDGEVLKLSSGYGIAYKTPSADGATAQITLSA